MDNEIKIKRMTAGDIPQVAELERECFSAPWSEAALQSELENSTSVLLCAHINSQICGYCGLQTVLDEGYITNIAVFPAFRGRGAAKKLVAALFDECKKLGLAFVTLEVRPSNIAATELYRRMGFAEVGRRKNFYTAPREDALLMTYFFNRED